MYVQNINFLYINMSLVDDDNDEDDGNEYGWIWGNIFSASSPIKSSFFLKVEECRSL